MDANEGSKPGGVGLAFLDLEAQCSDLESDSDLISESQSDAEDFIDNCAGNVGNHLAVFQEQNRQADSSHLTQLKRKLRVSPQAENAVDQLSPSVAAISITPRKRNALVKRRLFEGHAAGQDEAQDATAAPQVPTIYGSDDDCGGRSHSSAETPPQQRPQLHIQLMQSRNAIAARNKLFKKVFVVSFGDLTRIYKSNKTTNEQWVICGFGVIETMYAASIEQLKNVCLYFQATKREAEEGSVTLVLAQFRVAKSRDTVIKMLQTFWGIDSTCMMCEPPRIRGYCAALYWFKASLSGSVQEYGDVPSWIRAQTSVAEASAEAIKFDFGLLVQYAYDLNLLEESMLAYSYAQAASSDANARAWLSMNNQAKLIKDAVTMAKYYKKAEIMQLTMSAYIDRRCRKAPDGSWLNIAGFLNFQGIEPIVFVNALIPWLKGIPKKNCLAFIGPPDSGKSMFTNSLISFLGGRTLSYYNHSSHFWLSPLDEARFALLDDATESCLKYCDTYLRNLFDGYTISVDRKHKSYTEIKAPPLLLTTNIDYMQSAKYSYLHSRMTPFYFTEPLPMGEDGQPLFCLTDGDWKHFFKRLWRRLELSDQEEEGEDGSSGRTLACSSRSSNGPD